jgi:hypothetical protein
VRSRGVEIFAANPYQITLQLLEQRGTFFSPLSSHSWLVVDEKENSESYFFFLAAIHHTAFCQKKHQNFGQDSLFPTLSLFLLVGSLIHNRHNV